MIVNIKTVMIEILSVISFFKRLLMDQKHIRTSPFYNQIKKLQLNPDRPLFYDRQLELAEYYGTGKLGFLNLYLFNGLPNSMRFKKSLDSLFFKKTNPENLKSAYQEAAYFYSIRLMMAFERYSMFTRSLDYLLELFQNRSSHPLQDLRVLDYGCGVSDIGLILARNGAKITIADLRDEKLCFAEWRYKKRKLDVDVMPIDDTESIPDLPAGCFDLIIATEVLEHVRNPLFLLKSFIKWLSNNGYLFNSMGETFHRTLTGDHLEEALTIGNSEEYQKFYADNLKPVDILLNDEMYLFRKIVK